MASIKVEIIMYCPQCSALFKSALPDEYQACPRCGSESKRSATIDRPANYVIPNLACAHANTAAWKINAQSYLYCSVCKELEE